MTKTIKTCLPPAKKIAKAQGALISTLQWVCEDDDLSMMCWACGFSFTSPGKPERAHIVAASKGGSVSPDNFFLLCSRCHREQPDTCSRETQITWLRTHESSLERDIRDMRPMYRAVRSIMPPDLTMEEADEGVVALRAWLEAGGRVEAAAGMSPSTLRANHLWSAVDFIREWVATRSAVTRAPLTDVEPA